MSSHMNKNIFILLEWFLLYLAGKKKIDK